MRVQAEECVDEQRFQLPAQLGRLRAALSEANRAANKLAASFQDGALDMEDFVRQYRETRRLYHRRKLQTDAKELHWD